MNGIFRMDYNLAGAILVAVAAEKPYVWELPPPEVRRGPTRSTDHPLATLRRE
jgi:hypothetical protein